MTNIATAWTDAAKAVLVAHAESEAYYDSHMRPVNAAYAAGTATSEQVKEQEEAWSKFSDAHYDAVTALIMTPAPDLSAVAFKLRLAREMRFFDGADEPTSAALETIAADLERLSGESRS